MMILPHTPSTPFLAHTFRSIDVLALYLPYGKHHTKAAIRSSCVSGR